eukprot:TRINITY_DN10111_c0_g1_i5.p1 TRINITY_DN10111_c0_g1~~TRINITY_DN10111_c0_g1_i5.p1  ORF type:complete len:1136 (+),score=252.59 TRINITY_DN10111_c0_g1_i5:236-3643(+)
MEAVVSTQSTGEPAVGNIGVLMESNQQFEQTLQALMSGDNDVRGAAERVYQDTLTVYPDKVIQGLLQVTLMSHNTDLRAFSLVLLRRVLIASPGRWRLLEPQTKAMIKTETLRGIEKESNEYVRSLMREVTISLASGILGDGEVWDEILPFITHLCSSNQVYHKETALLMIANLISIYEKQFQGPNFQVLLQILQATLVDVAHPKLALASLEATIAIIPIYRELNDQLQLQSMFPSVLELLTHFLTSNQSHAQTALKSLVDLVELHPGYLKPLALQTISLMFNILTNPNMEQNTKYLALEFLIVFVERKPKFLAGLPDFSKTLLELLLHMMLDIPDIELPEWNMVQDDSDQDDLSSSAQVALDRVCISMNAEDVGPILFQHLPMMLGNKENWKFRYVGLMTLAMTAEGCFSVLSPQIQKLVEMILPHFSDSHPRVRWAAVNTAGQFAHDFGARFRDYSHDTVLPNLMLLLGDSQNPRVQKHAAMAIVTYCQGLPSRYIDLYADKLLGSLLGLMKSTIIPAVQEQAIAAVASIAISCNKKFQIYYSTFVPLLKEVIASACLDTLKTLRGTAIECLSVIAVAVGKETFLQDAESVLEMLSRIKLGADVDDPLQRYLLHAWVRLSACLKMDFAPYLGHVIPLLMKAANAGSGIALKTDDEPEPAGWDVVQVGNSKIAIHTAALEEKSTACNLLYYCAKEMTEQFYPYLLDVANLMTGCLTFYLHNGVRLSAYSSLAHLINSAKLRFLKTQNPNDFQFLLQLLSFLLPKVFAALEKESDVEVLVVGLEALGESLATIGSMLPVEFVPTVVQLLNQLISKMHYRVSKYLEKLSQSEVEEEEDDVIVLNDYLKKEEAVARELAETIGCLVRDMPTSFISAYPHLSQHVTSLIKQAWVPEKHLSVCIFADVMENTQGHPIVGDFLEYFVPFLLEFSMEGVASPLKTASIYALGSCAEYGGIKFVPYVPKVLEICTNEITRWQKQGNVLESWNDVDREEMENSYDNSVSALGKLVQFRANLLNDPQAVASLWVHCLPLTFDDLEAKTTHKRLCYLLHSGNVLVLGKNFCNFPKILTVIATLLTPPPPSEMLGMSEKILVDPETLQGFLQYLQRSPQQLLTEAVAVLSRPQKDTLIKTLEGWPK